MNTKILTALASCCAALILAGCGSTGHKRGGYYKDDGPGSDIPADILNTPDAVPRIESYAPANMRPYRVLGKSYVPLTSGKPFRETGIASWYGRKFHGRKTANGETYDMYAMTAAHPILPLPSYARVTRPDTGATVVVRINDRGPFHSSRVIDLSYAAAARLGLIGRGSGKVVVEAITHEDIARAQSGGGFQAPTATETALSAQLNQASASELRQAAPSATAVAFSSDTAPAPSTDPAASSTNTALASPTNTTVALTDSSETMAVELNDAVPVMPDALDAITPAPTVENSGAQIFLQYGAFSAPENAEYLAGKLNREIAMVESRQAEVRPSNNLYRVQIGPYSSRTEAVNAALRIHEQTGAQATVATRD